MQTYEPKISKELSFLYGEDVASDYLPIVLEKADRLRKAVGSRKFEKLDESDAILITYGDSIRQTGPEHPLQTLKRFLDRYVGQSISTVHILPFFPYTSDDGFSITDYVAVNPELGTWDDIDRIGQEYRMMFDLVANHCSRSSHWFEAYRQGRAPYTDYFITCNPSADYRTVFRPRALPLLSETETVEGTKWVWTTFSYDQIDLNYKNPDLLMEILDILCFYIANGASFVRLDAIAFIWKQPGTSCLHLPQVHSIVRLMRDLTKAAGLDVKFVTETNVPHEQNISYFGNGTEEATMVYNFPLPPLTLHAFMNRDTSILRTWASTLETPGPETTFFNFLASHDGIGVLSAQGYIPEEEVALMARKTTELGGHVSMKDNGDGTESCYELNINFLDALDMAGTVDQPTKIRRFLAAQALMLSLRGVPGIYIHSLLGSSGDVGAVLETGSWRSINRKKLDFDRLSRELEDTGSTQARILAGYRKLLEARRKEPCFSPYAGQQVVDDLDSRVFAVRRSLDDRSILCLVNASNEPVTVGFRGKRNLLGPRFSGTLGPYRCAWLRE
jgi:sucrose phosphorylase